MSRIYLKLSGFLSSLLICLAGTAVADRLQIDNEYFGLRISTPAPSALAAFYEGRGFPAAMIAILRQQCFINIGLRNKSNGIVWFDLNNWQFSTRDGPLQPYTRQYWKDQWNKHGFELRHQSVFRWTLMPQQLDFRPGEGEAGNLVLPRTSLPIQITGTLAVGNNKDKIISIEFKDVLCADDPASP